MHASIAFTAWLLSLQLGKIIEYIFAKSSSPNNCNGFLGEVDSRIASSLSNPGKRAWFDSHVGRPLASVTSDCCARL